MKFRTLDDKIAIVPIDSSDSTPGGIMIPAASRSRVLATTGTIVQVGPGYLSNGVRIPVVVG